MFLTALYSSTSYHILWIKYTLEVLGLGAESSSLFKRELNRNFFFHRQIMNTDELKITVILKFISLSLDVLKLNCPFDRHMIVLLLHLTFRLHWSRTLKVLLQ